jgi:hypothetical protein
MAKATTALEFLRLLLLLLLRFSWLLLFAFEVVGTEEAVAYGSGRGASSPPRFDDLV